MHNSCHDADRDIRCRSLALKNSMPASCGHVGSVLYSELCTSFSSRCNAGFRRSHMSLPHRRPSSGGTAQRDNAVPSSNRGPPASTSERQIHRELQQTNNDVAGTPLPDESTLTSASRVVPASLRNRSLEEVNVSQVGFAWRCHSRMGSQGGWLLYYSLHSFTCCSWACLRGSRCPSVIVRRPSLVPASRRRSKTTCPGERFRTP